MQPSLSASIPTFSGCLTNRSYQSSTISQETLSRLVWSWTHFEFLNGVKETWVPLHKVPSSAKKNRRAEDQDAEVYRRGRNRCLWRPKTPEEKEDEIKTRWYVVQRSERLREMLRAPMELARSKTESRRVRRLYWAIDTSP